MDKQPAILLVEDDPDMTGVPESWYDREKNTPDPARRNQFRMERLRASADNTIVRYWNNQGFRPELATTVEDSLALIEHHGLSFRAALIDKGARNAPGSLGHHGGLDVVQALRTKNPDCFIAVWSGEGTFSPEVVESGISAFTLKPTELDWLVRTVREGINFGHQEGTVFILNTLGSYIPSEQHGVRLYEINGTSSLETYFSGTKHHPERR